MPRNEQHIRAMALDSAIRLVSGPRKINLTNVDNPGATEKELILDLADQFADYITSGRD